MHLHCTYAAQECKAIGEILDGFLANPTSGQQVGIFAEMEIRRENALEEVRKLVELIDELAKTETDPVLGLKEMGKRAQRQLGKIESLKVHVDALERLVHMTPALQQQGQSRAPLQQVQ